MRKKRIDSIWVDEVVNTLRGESPMSGVQSVVINVDEFGKKLHMSSIIREVGNGIGDVVTIIGKPFRQIEALSELVKGLFDYRVIIESSGRIGVPTSSKRKVMVPIVDSTTLVIKPNVEFLNDKYYGWMKEYGLSYLYIKFEWQGSEKKTNDIINKFFKITNIKQMNLIKSRSLIVMPSDSTDVDQCRKVWMYCLKYHTRYSGREYRRLYNSMSMIESGGGYGMRTK